jgi:hypothetical protein
MLGPVLVVDPPPGSALRLLVVNFLWACSGTAVRLTAMGSPDPSMDGAGDGHGRLLRAGYPVSWGSRAVWAPALRFRTSQHY